MHPVDHPVLEGSGKCISWPYWKHYHLKSFNKNLSFLGSAPSSSALAALVGGGRTIGNSEGVIRYLFAQTCQQPDSSLPQLFEEPSVDALCCQQSLGDYKAQERWAGKLY